MTEVQAVIVNPRLTDDKTGVLMDVHPFVVCKNCRFGARALNVLDEERISCECPGPFVNKELLLPLDWYCADGEAKQDED